MNLWGLNITLPHNFLGTIDFEALKTGLENKSLTYIDVRNKSELQKEGKVVGSVNIPRT